MRKVALSLMLAASMAATTLGSTAVFCIRRNHNGV